MPEKEKVIKGTVVKQDYVKQGSKWKLVNQSKNNNAILNPKHWRDASIGAKGTLSTGSIYNSRGRFEIMLEYTSVSPDKKQKSVRVTDPNSAYKTEEFL